MTRGIRQRSPGSWEITVSTGRRDQRGRYGRIVKTVRGSKREAERQRAGIIAQLAAGTYFRPSMGTVAAFLEHWLETERNLRPGTRLRYQHIIRQHILPHLGEQLLLRELDPSTVLDLDRKWRGAKLASGTIRLNYAVLHRALKQAVRRRLLTSNPADVIQPPRVERTEREVLDEGALAMLLGALDADHESVAFALLIHTGRRLGEVLGLRWRDVDLSKAMIHVQQQYTTRRTFEPVKTKRANRIIDIDSGLVALLRTHRADQNEKRLLAGSAWLGHDLVVCGSIGEPLTHSVIEKIFKTTVKRLGLPATLRPHDLRHSHASVLLARGADLNTVADRLGHGSAAFTLSVCGHSLSGRQAKAAASFASALERAAR